MDFFKTFIYVDGTKGWLVTNESTDATGESSNFYVQQQVEQ
jgi:hypothetical protein